MKELCNLNVFCGYLAREIIDAELRRFAPDWWEAQFSAFSKEVFKQTPAQRGEQDGSIAKAGLSPLFPKSSTTSREE